MTTKSEREMERYETHIRSCRESAEQKKQPRLSQEHAELVIREGWSDRHAATSVGWTESEIAALREWMKQL